MYVLPKKGKQKRKRNENRVAADASFYTNTFDFCILIAGPQQQYIVECGKR